MVRNDGVDYVFAEPSGIVIPFELRNAVAVAGRDVRVSAGPVVMLLSAADPGAPFIEHLAHVTRQQIEQADCVAVTKIDAAANGGVECLEGAVRSVSPDTPLHHLSLPTGQGLKGLADLVLAQQHVQGGGSL
jgi:G3E family GTPase